MQHIRYGDSSITSLVEAIDGLDAHRIMLLHSRSFYGSKFKSLSEMDKIVCRFGDVIPNPTYEQVQFALDYFIRNDCDGVVAIGGGSVIDVAKAVLYSFKEKNNTIGEEPHTTPFLAVPTTAGSGSESTSFAAIYRDGIKTSISDSSLLPTHIYLDGSTLESLPVYQRKCTALDALCQSIESIWSVGSTDESVRYAKKAISTILDNIDEYTSGSNTCNQEMMIASNYSGQAICISKTTAAHAMSYRITTLYRIPHGHAVAICLPIVWRYIADNMNLCQDSRGIGHLQKSMRTICELFESDNDVDAIEKYQNILKRLQIEPPTNICDKDLVDMEQSVNMERLGNTPVSIDSSDIHELYYNVFNASLS